MYPCTPSTSVVFVTILAAIQREATGLKGLGNGMPQIQASQAVWYPSTAHSPNLARVIPGARTRLKGIKTGLLEREAVPRVLASPTQQPASLRHTDVGLLIRYLSTPAS